MFTHITKRRPTQATEPQSVPCTRLELAETVTVVGDDVDEDPVGWLLVEELFLVDVLTVSSPVEPVLSGLVTVVEADWPDPSDVLKIVGVSMISLEVVVVGKSSSAVVATFSVADAVFGGKDTEVIVVLAWLELGTVSPPGAQWPSDVHVSPSSQYPPFEQHTPLLVMQLLCIRLSSWSSDIGKHFQFQLTRHHTPPRRYRM